MSRDDRPIPAGVLSWLDGVCGRGPGRAGQQQDLETLLDHCRDQARVAGPEAGWCWRPAGDSLGAAGANPWWTGRIAMTVEGFWWLALLVQCLALPGTLLPLLPGLIWLPIGAALWRLWRACW